MGKPADTKDLTVLMRHEDFNTTLKFYAGRNAEKTDDAARAAYEVAKARQQAGKKTGPVNTFVNSQPPTVPVAEARNDTSPCFARACGVEDIGLEPTTF